MILAYSSLLLEALHEIEQMWSFHPESLTHDNSLARRLLDPCNTSSLFENKPLVAVSNISPSPKPLNILILNVKIVLPVHKVTDQ